MSDETSTTVANPDPSPTLRIPFIVGLAFVTAVLLVDPVGNFPLNDDWDFALTTWKLAETGTFAPGPFLSSSLRLQALWGALWTLVFGRSFTVLRFSTLALSAATLLIFERYLARLRISSPVRLFAVLSLLFHPVFFWSSHTYMTHVPYLFMSILALTFFHRGLSEDRMALLWIGAAAVVGSSFVRQMGITNAIAPIVVLLILRRRVSPRWKSLLLPALSALLLILLLIFGTGTLISSPHAFEFHQRGLDASAASILFNFVVDPMLRVFFNFQSAAVFTLPILAVLIAGRVGLGKRGAWLSLAVAVPFGLILWRLVTINDLMPYHHGGNVFTNLGLGPHTLRDVFILGYPYPIHLAHLSRLILTFGGAAVGVWALVLCVIASSGENDDTRPEISIGARLYSIHALTGMLVLCLMRTYFDRYALDSLWALIPLGALLIPRNSIRSLTVGWVLLVPIAVFVVAATAEYLSWNGARWKAFEVANSRGVSLSQMDGGYEINAPLAVRYGKGDLGKPGFGVIDDEYIITFNPVRGYRVLAAFPYVRPLGFDHGNVLLQRRIDPPLTIETPSQENRKRN